MGILILIIIAYFAISGVVTCGGLWLAALLFGIELLGIVGSCFRSKN